MTAVAAPAPAPQKPSAGGCSTCGRTGCPQCTPGKATRVGATTPDGRLLSEHERKPFDAVKRESRDGSGRQTPDNPFAPPGQTQIAGETSQALAETPARNWPDRSRLGAATQAYRAVW